MKATTGEAAGSGAGGGEAPVTGRGALAGEGASGPVCLAGGCGHDPPGWSPAATGHAVGHRVVARPLPLPAPPARHAHHAFVNNAGEQVGWEEEMITGVHTMFYTSEPEAMRAFLRDKLGFPHTDVGHGWQHAGSAGTARHVRAR